MSRDQTDVSALFKHLKFAGVMMVIRGLIVDRRARSTPIGSTSC